MHCPFCGHPHSKVTDSRVAESGIRRRRECQSCELRFTTYERVQAALLMVSKQDNRREEFNREKLISGIRKACTKRPVSSRTLDKMVEDIEAELQQMGHAEVSTTVLGTMVMERLRDLDRVAYIRYASVYRDFDDLEEFTTAIETLQGFQKDEQQEASAGQLRLLPEEPAAQRRPRRGRRPRTTLPADASSIKQETEEASTKE
jgi:transcriptional repressor NrdR